MSVSTALEHFLEERRNDRALNIPLAEAREALEEDGYLYFFRGCAQWMYHAASLQ